MQGEKPPPQNQRAPEDQISPADSRPEREQLYRQYQAWFDFAPVGYLLLEPEGTIREANQTAADLLKTEKRKLVGTSLDNFIHPNAQNRVSAGLFSRPDGGPIDRSWNRCMATFR